VDINDVTQLIAIN